MGATPEKRIGAGWALAAVWLAVSVPATAGDADEFVGRVAPLVQKYCVDCHSEASPSGGVALDRYEDRSAALRSASTWLKVRTVLEGQSMPPVDEEQPTVDEREAILGWIEDDLLMAQGAGAAVPPVVIRRLNRQEYDNTIRDLLGTTLKLSDSFPADDIGFGFDNVGSALNISPVHVDKYIEAAEVALDRAIVVPDAGDHPPAELIGLQTYPLPPDKPVEFAHTMKPGLYLADFSLVRVGIAETVPPPRLVIGFGSDSRTVDAVRVQDETVVYRYWLRVVEGDDTVRVALAPGQAEGPNVVKPTEVTANVSGDQRYGNKRGLHVDSMVVRGPVVVSDEQLPASHRKILGTPPGLGDEARRDAGRKVIERFARRAYRRPITEDEADRLMMVFRLADDRGESFERSIQVALSTVLASPAFLFLAEPAETDADRPLTDHELASRLSYFLWSSMPDDELAAAADSGTLRSQLRTQVDRMLADPKADAFVSNFVGQWLQLRKLVGVARDPALFPDFDDALRSAMREETERSFAYVLREDRSVLELLNAEYSFLNERLASHYGIDGVSGEAFRKVTLADQRRGGVLTQASVLTVTSNPNRTSPVKRGQFILQQLLGTPPPPPPPDVPKLDEDPKAADVASLRERLEVHRTSPDCASCHRQMDPLGFALENYDAIGRWRERDGEFPIDASGELAGDVKFANAAELKARLVEGASKKFTRNLVENLMTYALGRGLEPSDHRTVEEIRRGLGTNQYRLRPIVYGIVESRAFQNRGAAAAAE